MAQKTEQVALQVYLSSPQGHLKLALAAQTVCWALLLANSLSGLGEAIDLTERSKELVQQLKKQGPVAELERLLERSE